MTVGLDCALSDMELTHLQDAGAVTIHVLPYVDLGAWVPAVIRQVDASLGLAVAIFPTTAPNFYRVVAAA